MRTALFLALVELLPLTGPDNQVIFLDKSKVTTLRSPRGTDNFAAGTKCIIFTVDGKNINVREPCDKVRKMLQEGAPP